MKVQIAAKVAAGLTQEKVNATHKILDMEFLEFVKFQELKSAACMDKLTMEEAQLIYTYLGETPEHFNQQPVEVKAVLTQIFGELLGSRIAARV
jgi:hypothetical protein